MVASMVLSGAFTFAFSIALLFGIGDLTAALNTPTNLPIIEIFKTATQSNRATNAMTAALISSLLFSSFGLVASASRLTWAFARDKGLPYSSYLSHVSSFIVTYCLLDSSIRSLLTVYQFSYSGGQKLPYPGSHGGIGGTCDVFARPYKYRVNYCIQCTGLPYGDRTIHVLLTLDHPAIHAKARPEACSSGPISNKLPFWVSGQWAQHGIFGHGYYPQRLPTISARQRAEHELR